MNSVPLAAVLAVIELGLWCALFFGRNYWRRRGRATILILIGIAYILTLASAYCAAL